MVIDITRNGRGCIRSPNVVVPDREDYARFLRIRRLFSTERSAMTIVIGEPNSVASNYEAEEFVSFSGRSGACPQFHRGALRAESIGSGWTHIIAFVHERGPNRSNEFDNVLEVLRNTKIPLSSSRQNVLPAGHAAVRSCLLGALSQGAKRGVTALTKKLPECTMALTKLAKDFFPDFKYNAITVNSGYSARPHVDKRNEGPSMILALGDFRGGRLWIQNANGSVSKEIEQAVPRHPAGTYKGSYHDIHNRLVQFDGRTLHAAEDHLGERYSIIGFNTPGVDGWRAEEKAELEMYGFQPKPGAARTVGGESADELPVPPCLPAVKEEVFKTLKAGVLKGGTESTPSNAKTPTQTTLKEEVFKTLIARVLKGGTKSSCSQGFLTTGVPNSKFRRCIVELCAHADSILGREAPEDCEVIRITEDDDLLSAAGFEKAVNSIRGACHRYGREKVLVWVSTPCTGGTARHMANVAKYARRDNIQALVRLFAK